MLGALTAGLLGRKIGVTGAHIVTCTALVASALLSIVAFYEVGLSGSPVVINLSSWIDSESMLVNWAFLFDSLTVSMLLPVLVVSSLVHIFSVDYMAADPHNQRFFSYLSMFTFFMLVLVAGDNYLVMFVGWEGIGVSSYLLVGFWFTRIQANKSAIKAMTVNRVGDMFLSIGFFALFWAFGNLDYSTVFSLSPFINESALTIIGLLLLLAAMGKSAQLGLHTWLPDAMEGWNYIGVLFLIMWSYYAFEGSNSFIELTTLAISPVLCTVDKPTMGSITGCLLGDGHIRVGSRSVGNVTKGNARYAMTMKASSKEYMEWLQKTVFHHLIPLPCSLTPYPNVDLVHHKGKQVQQYSFATASTPLFTALHNLWYRWDLENAKFIKIVPLNIKDIFTKESLLHWIIQDGYFDNYGRAQTVLLCTESFTKAECILLQEVLTYYNLNSTLKQRNKKRDTYRIRLSKNSMTTLIHLIGRDLPRNFKYKLGTDKGMWSQANQSKLGPSFI